MARLTYEEALRYALNDLRIIDDEPYRLTSIISNCKDGIRTIELKWEHVVNIFLNATMVKFPGSISYIKLEDILDATQCDFDPVEEVIEDES